MSLIESCQFDASLRFMSVRKRKLNHSIITKKGNDVPMKIPWSRKSTTRAMVAHDKIKEHEPTRATTAATPRDFTALERPIAAIPPNAAVE